MLRSWQKVISKLQNFTDFHHSAGSLQHWENKNFPGEKKEQSYTPGASSFTPSSSFPRSFDHTSRLLFHQTLFNFITRERKVPNPNGLKESRTTYPQCCHTSIPGNIDQARQPIADVHKQRVAKYFHWDTTKSTHRSHSVTESNQP